MQPMFQPNQIWKSKLSSLTGHYFLATKVTSRYIQFRDTYSNRMLAPSSNSLFVDGLSYIGTADEFPELLI